MFDSLLNKTLITLLKSAINSKLDNIGEIESLDINTTDKKLWGKVLLRGEEKPLDFEVKYKISKGEDNQYYFDIVDLFTSKIWLNNAFRTFGKKNSFPIPKEYGKFVNMLI